MMKSFQISAAKLPITAGLLEKYVDQKNIQAEMEIEHFTAEGRNAYQQLVLVMWQKMQQWTDKKRKKHLANVNITSVPIPTLVVLSTSESADSGRTHSNTASEQQPVSWFCD